ncbi:MRG-domain-containing protein [Coccomyxa subellipsoidea C-169]|uniref:MRG-domain-containing protein n=1 Tax=Coccomyxa subellipsoidea (strain C-169) TaxID=574566 RepID=I0Z3K8_COCSC|nr:MRG-domain-containing protein [Coccomyxa subellipsoidea C-169]EIE25227.1 MRG-domain-containing protein [Coccomyxa subellipsoidea C-169]|eukprot:XP_005649771.1 MRG-domain-containing protein [Coccomyxa subellipsoidea C-169]
MARDRGPFRTGERVLVPHTDKYYEAKGWNKKWDEWVEATGLTKYKKELAKVEFTKEGEGGTREFGGKAEAAEGNGKSRAEAGRKSEKGQKQTVSSMVRVQLPTALKQKLIEDWDRMQSGSVASLPRRPSVNDILLQFVDACKSNKDLVEPEEEVANGLRIYFDKALRHMLLYPQEMEQAVKALSDGTTPSSLYGAEHLLRLFLKLPDLLPANQMSADDQLQLEMRLSSFLKFLLKNEGLYFLSPGLPDQNATS